MASTLSKVVATSVILIAVFYQLVLKSLIFDTLGYGRVLEPLSNFNVRCEKLDDLGLEACEDMWMHEPSGNLYLACGSTSERLEWFPPLDGHLNAKGRKTTDRIAILDTRASGPWRDRLRWMTTPGFTGSHGDGFLNLHGLDILVDPKNPSKLRILLNNHRPPMDPKTGKLLDAPKIGANSTIEVFETTVGESTMAHVKTYAYPAINVPNGVAWVTEDSFLFTNDHSAKVGFRRTLDLATSSFGSVGYCSPTGCRIVASSGFSYANGIILGHDGYVYVANSASGAVYVHTFDSSTETLTKINEITIPHPIDNLRQDSKGDIYASSFPMAYRLGELAVKPFEISLPASGWRISTTGGVYEIKKVLEDDGTVLPSATVLVHDPETGGLFMGGALAPWISVCEPLK